MPKIAVDIVLLPPGKITELAIDLNNNLLEKDDSYPTLSKNDFLPHLTLAMGAVKTEDLPKIKDILESIASKWPPLQLVIGGAKVKKRDDGKKVASLAIEKTKELLALHGDVLNAMKNYFTYEGSVDMFTSPPKIDKIPVYWIKNYHKTSVLDKYNPHVTLGIGVPKQIKYPIKFETKTLALCHLGNYCTCRKVLYSTTLKP